MSAAAAVIALFQDEATRHVGHLRAGLERLAASPDDIAAVTRVRTAAGALAEMALLVEAEALANVARALEQRFGRGAPDRALLEAARGALGLLEACIGAPDPKQCGETDRAQAVLRALASPVASVAKTPQTAVRETMSVPDPALLGLFTQDLEHCVAELAQHLVALEESRGSPATLERLMRAAHSLKGAARITGLDVLVDLAHVMEDCFVAAQRGSLVLEPAHIDVLLAATDRMTALARVPADQLAAVLNAREPELRVISAQVAQISAPGNAAPPRLSIEPSLPPDPLLPSVIERLSSRAPENEGAASGDRVVRVTARSIERFVGLSGEALVEARRAGHFVDALARLKHHQSALADVIESHLAATGGASAELTEALSTCRNTTNELLGDLESYGRTLEDLSGRLYGEALKSRMRPFADGVQSLRRLARDTARRLGKKLVLEVIGERTGVDRDVLDTLGHPLQHLVRNAIDHGLEGPDARAASGKPAEGRLRIEARHHAGMLAITVSDDGAGVDLARLREKLIDRGLSERSVVERLSEAELLDFLFLPGFSTAREVSDISGRGVGLDVVKSAIEAAGGHVRVSTSAGRGTAFHLKLPVTRSVIRAVIVEIGSEPYAFPLLRVERLVKVPYSAVHTLERRRYVDLDGTSVGIVSAHELLETGDGETGDELLVVVVGDGARSFGLCVDRFLGEQDLVVRPLDTRLGKVPNVSAAAILSHGAPVLILDVEDVVRSIHQLLSREGPARRGRVERARAKKRVLVVDDSLTVRELQKQLLMTQGYEVDVAIDGMDGWQCLNKKVYDLVISDIDMPRMNGFALVKRIKDDERLSALPIVIVSYKDRPEDRVKGLEAGANYYLTKTSFQDHTLLDAVIDLIGEAS
jgi:two-component system sensor histidine kinase and response regulator WspE